MVEQMSAKPREISTGTLVDCLFGLFGDDKPLTGLTRADAKRWERWLRAYVVRRDQHGDPIKTMAASTVSKHIKRARTMFQEAVDDRLLAESPMEAIKGGDEVNRDRDFFVDFATAYKVLQACPDHEWRLIFALARFGGLRRCELLTICWSDIVWDHGRMQLDSPKTGSRTVPIFPELLPYLEDAFNVAPEGAISCVQRYTRAANLGTQMNRIIRLAGLCPWEKTFQNLRASRRTELEEQFPNHVINHWLGHSARVAEKNYLQVTPDHWTAATTICTKSNVDQSGGVTGGVINADQRKSAPITPIKNPVNMTTDESGRTGMELLAPPRGLEPLTRWLTATCSTN